MPGCERAGLLRQAAKWGQDGRQPSVDPDSAVVTTIALALSALALHGLHAPPGTVYHLQPCPDGGSSCTYPGTHDIYLASGWRRRDLYHEIGHQVDYWMATDADRQTFEQIMGDTRPWRSGPSAPNERFAEAFALCGFSLKTVRRWGAGLILGGYKYWPSIGQYLRTCTLMRTIETRDDPTIAADRLVTFVP